MHGVADQTWFGPECLGAWDHVGVPAKPASEQPGNSFRYLYQKLSEKEFQQLCSALIRLNYPNARCFPVGMSDGGRDITDPEQSLVYQVKWTSKVEQDPVSWLKKAIEGERQNIERLVKEEGVTQYRLMTSVAATSPSRRGSRDRLDSELLALSKAYNVHIECMWQADIDAMIDVAPDALKWSYSSMLVGNDNMRALADREHAESRTNAMRQTLSKVMSAQWGEDSKVKFSQIDMDSHNLVDLYVDVQKVSERRPTHILESNYELADKGAEGAVKYLLRTAMPLTLVHGEPGQGKSTMGQYLCQVHRAAILPHDVVTMGKSPSEKVDEPKLAIRSDLKDYAAWLQGNDPWADSDAKRVRPLDTARSLEHFLAALCRQYSGGRSVTVEQIQDVIERYPTLIVLDGLDEVADSAMRSEVVSQIEAFARRIRMTSQTKFQIVVTTRPNNGGLAEPSADMFETIKLAPLNPELQNTYVRKWAAAHQIRGTQQRSIEKIFRARSAAEHVAQLTGNPMQLAILLFLVNRRGEGVPEARTPMYTQFMETLLDREVEKAQVVKENVSWIYSLTSYLGWLIQAGVEAATVPERLPTKKIKRLLRNYLDEVGGPMDLVENLFVSIADRFWALSSKVEGTFEFSVQSVREYFTARFLAEYAGLFGSPTVLKSDVLCALVERSYWANTARFYAGFASPNELMELVSGLDEAISRGRHPLEVRSATANLLADGVFSPVPKAQKAAAHLLADPLSIRLLRRSWGSEVGIGGIPSDRGGSWLAKELLEASEDRPESAISKEAVRLLPNLGVSRAEFQDWWAPRLDRVLGSELESSWLELGTCFPNMTLGDGDATRISLDSLMARRAAVGLNANFMSGASSEGVLLRSVLDGECSDTTTSGSSLPCALLRVVRPQRFLDLAWEDDSTEELGSHPLFVIEVGHKGDVQAERRARSTVFRRLIKLDTRYMDLMQASAFRKNERGTTAPWQHSARQLAAIHGPCLLAAEIAVMGAALTKLTTGGSVTRGADPFGPSTDHGMLVQETRAHISSVDWWAQQASRCEDQLSRATWSLALVGIASASVVESQVSELSESLNSLPEEFFDSVAQASSRLGACGLARRLPQSFLSRAGAASRRAMLLLTHHSASLAELDGLPWATVSDLSSLAEYGNSSWPILRAVTRRLLDGEANADELLTVLEKCGSDSVIVVPRSKPLQRDAVTKAILERPGVFPFGWVEASEYWNSANNWERPLDEVALERGWTPDL